MLVWTVIIGDHVHIFVRALAVWVFEKTKGFFMRMAIDASSLNGSLMDQDCREKTRGSMPCVGMGLSSGLARSQWKHRLSAIQGLDLRFFVHADNQGVFRRAQIQSDNGGLLFTEFRVRTLSAPVLRFVRLERCLIKKMDFPISPPHFLEAN